MSLNKVLGVLYGAAHGDSRGAVTEFCTRKEIIAHFPDECRGYHPSISRITHDITPGSVTDDFGSSSYFMKAIMKHAGNFNQEIAIEAVLDWSEDPIVFDRYAGENSKKSIVLLKQGLVIDEQSKVMHFSRQNTNGGAMKASPIGLLAKGDHEKAIAYAKDLCWPTHYNSAAVSATAAIACAITETLNPGVTLESIFEAAIKGARTARCDLEEAGFDSFGPYVDIKIEEAIAKGAASTNKAELFQILEGSVGTGIWVQESIPAVFAIIAATQGNYDESLLVAMNCGGDTDTISSITGAILGGLHGIEVVPTEDIKHINAMNKFLDLDETIHAYSEFIETL